MILPWVLPKVHEPQLYFALDIDISLHSDTNILQNKILDFFFF